MFSTENKNFISRWFVLTVKLDQQEEVVADLQDRLVVEVVLPDLLEPSEY